MDGCERERPWRKRLLTFPSCPFLEHSLPLPFLFEVIDLQCIYESLIAFYFGLWRAFLHFYYK